jgi:hypothetical protein
MVNSKGETITVEDEVTVMNDFPNFEKRKTEMLEVLKHISNIIRKKINIVYSYQEKNYKEKVYIPFREEVLSSDRLAKKYIQFKNNEYKEKTDIDVLKSMVRIKAESGIKFYLVTLGCITIERNYADNEIISIQYSRPVPYYQFAIKIKQETEKAIDTEKYTVISDIDYKTLFKNGTVKAYSEDVSKTDTDIERLVEKLNQNKAVDSNRANECFKQISIKRKDFFAEYRTIKEMMIKTFPRSRGIIYNKDKSCIRAVLKEDNVERYVNVLVGGTAENPCYIFNGKTADSVSKLQKLLIANEKEEWFTQVINAL